MVLVWFGGGNRNAQSQPWYIAPARSLFQTTIAPFACTCSWHQHAKRVCVWLFVELEQLKQQTGAVRSRLDNFDLQLWKPLTKSTNPTKNIVGAVWRSCNPEMCTNAWVKMFELLARCSLFRQLDSAPTTEK